MRRDQRTVCAAALSALLVCLLLLSSRATMAEAIEETPPMALECASAVLLEASTGQIVFAENPDERRAVASVTKIMTILLTCEALEAGRVDIADTVTVSQRASSMGGSQALLDTGEKQSLATLLKCMIVASANDAAVAIAEHTYGGEESFVRRMNARARELGMADTHFVNVTGLPAEGHYTTARDVAVMSRALLTHARFFEYSGIWMDTLDHGDGRVTELTNTNRLTRLYEGCDGLKTGSTNEAGYCISATAMRDDLRLIAVVLGAPTGKTRFDTAASMLDYGFANYELYAPIKAGARVKQRIPVVGGAKESVALALGADLRVLIAKGKAQDVILRQQLDEAARAPVAEGAKLGALALTLDGRVIGDVPIVAAESVEQENFGDALRRVGRHFYQM